MQRYRKKPAKHTQSYSLNGQLCEIDLHENHDRYAKAISYYMQGNPMWRCIRQFGVKETTFRRLLEKNNIEIRPPKRPDEKWNGWGDWVYPPPRPWD